MFTVGGGREGVYGKIDLSYKSQTRETSKVREQKKKKKTRKRLTTGGTTESTALEINTGSSHRS